VGFFAYTWDINVVCGKYKSSSSVSREPGNVEKSDFLFYPYIICGKDKRLSVNLDPLFVFVFFL
jgi:hypothetical protein